MKNLGGWEERLRFHLENFRNDYEFVIVDRAVLTLDFRNDDAPEVEQAGKLELTGKLLLRPTLLGTQSADIRSNAISVTIRHSVLLGELDFGGSERLGGSPRRTEF